MDLCKKTFPLLLFFALGFIALSFYINPAFAQTDEIVQVIRLSKNGHERANSLAFSSDGRYLAVGSSAGIYLYDAKTAKAMDFIQTDVWARSVVFLPASDVLAAGLFDSTIRMWHLPSGQADKTLEGHRGWVRSIAVSQDGVLLASASDDDTIRVWNAEDGSVILDERAVGVRAVALSPDGQLVAAALGDKTVRLWRIMDGKLLYTLSGHTDWVRCLAFSPDNNLLASGSFDKTVLLWNVSDGSLVRTLRGHTSSVLGVAFSPDGSLLASGSVDGTVRLWQVSNGSPIHILLGHTDFVYTVAFSSDGKRLASGGADNSVRLWNINELSKLSSLEVRENQFKNDHVPGSDCRLCHHRRGKVEAARVIELGCEGCHPGGISLAWCPAFPRSTSMMPSPLMYQAEDILSGVPIGSDEVAVTIATPGNGETLYIYGNFMAPEFISGRVFYAYPEAVSEVKVQLSIFSADQEVASLITFPGGSGEFNFDVAINADAPPPHLLKPGTRVCLACHGDFVPLANLPEGVVRVVVTATAPSGQQARDERWLRVDSSEDVTIPLQVIDRDSRAPLSDILVRAVTTLYEWRNRFGSAQSNIKGEAWLYLESLSQTQTVYNLSIPPQVVNGIRYAGGEPVQLVLEPGVHSYPVTTLTAAAQLGRVSGKVSGDVAKDLISTKVWAVQWPTGPAYLTSLSPQGVFFFNGMPVSQYIVLLDPVELAGQNLYADQQMVDLISNPQTDISFELIKGMKLIGKIMTQGAETLPFAWVKVGEGENVYGINPVSGEFMISPLPADMKYLTVVAPGYYSQTQPVSTTQETLVFDLTPRPESHRVAWGNGQVMLPPETKAAVTGTDIDLEYGWLWGEGSASEPLEIHLAGLDVVISSGRFALEVPLEGVGWLYLYQGSSRILFKESLTPTVMESGQMIALLPGAKPIPMDEVVAMALRPQLDEAPVPEIFEPSLSTRVRNWLIKAGISTAQMITFMTVILSVIVLLALPLIIIFGRRKKRNSSIS